MEYAYIQFGQRFGGDTTNLLILFVCICKYGKPLLERPIKSNLIDKFLEVWVK